MIQWRIGCSGYHYDEWKGVFYPEGMSESKWFDFYCEHFNTIELNTTFYKFPRVEFLRKLYDRSPANFKFSIKAPRLITHFRKFKDAQKYLSDFYSAVADGLQEKTACVLFQFPANFLFDEDRLEKIVTLLDKSYKNVLEFRHPSWWQENVFQSLAHNNITFSGMSHPELPVDVIRTSNIVYYRFHGVPHLYTSKYDLVELERIANELNGQTSVEEAYLYFNNTAEGAAIINARQLHEISELVH